jgi:group I intron endonuclease
MKAYKFYKATNAKTGKSYIGLTAQPTIQDRWADHLKDATNGLDYHLHRAIRKYGPSVWSVELLTTVGCTKPKACEIERALIELHQTYEFGYNMTTGGDGGDLLSKKTREELDAIKDKKNETKLQNHGTLGWTDANWLAFYSLSQEERDTVNARRSVTMKAQGTEHGIKVSEGHAKRTDEQKAQTAQIISHKVREAFKNRKTDPSAWNEYIAELKARNSKRVHTPLGEFASLKEASTITGISNTTLRRKINSNEHPDFYYV